MMPLGSVLDCGTWFSLIEEQLLSYGEGVIRMKNFAYDVGLDAEPAPTALYQPGHHCTEQVETNHAPA